MKFLNHCWHVTHSLDHVTFLPVWNNLYLKTTKCNCSLILLCIKGIHLVAGTNQCMTKLKSILFANLSVSVSLPTHQKMTIIMILQALSYFLKAAFCERMSCHLKESSLCFKFKEKCGDFGIARNEKFIWLWYHN